MWKTPFCFHGKDPLQVLSLSQGVWPHAFLPQFFSHSWGNQHPTAASLEKEMWSGHNTNCKHNKALEMCSEGDQEVARGEGQVVARE